MGRTIQILLTGAIILLAGGIDYARADHGIDVRELRAAGKIIPLEQIIENAQQRHAGRLLESELTLVKGRYIYEIELLDKSGQIRELFFDAQTGEFLEEMQEQEYGNHEAAGDRGRQGAQ